MKNRFISIGLLTATLFSGCLINKNLKSKNMSQRKYHQLVILWITDSVKFQSYLGQMAPIVTKYGGALDKSFTPIEFWADGLEKPQVINLVHYDSKESFENFKSDPDFKKIVHLRDESTKIISFEGYLDIENVQKGNENLREYNIEIVSFKKESFYEKYEKIGEGKMKEYGLELEYKMQPEQNSTNTFKPDLMKISYFPSVEQKKLFENDSMHKVIEHELYPNAVDKVIWISAKFLR